MASLDIADVRLEYAVYLEEESGFLERRLMAYDILFSFLFAPVSRQSPPGAIRQPQVEVVHTGVSDSRAVSTAVGQPLAEAAQGREGINAVPDQGLHSG
jgi:hypothetical protein